MPRHPKPAWSDGYLGHDNRGKWKPNPAHYPPGSPQNPLLASPPALGYDPRKLAEISQRAIHRHQAKLDNARIATEEVQHRHKADEARADEVIHEDAAEYETLLAEQDDIDTPIHNCERGSSPW